MPEFIEEGVKDVPLRKRQTQQKLATSMGVSKTTVHHWIVASMIHVHCNSLKPILTEENKWARFEMALSFRNPAKLCARVEYNQINQTQSGIELLSLIHTITHTYDEQWVKQVHALDKNKEDYYTLKQERGQLMDDFYKSF